jgi:hypothetical protein
VDLYTNADARLWATSRSSFLGALPDHLKSAVEDIDKAVARADSLSGAVRASVDSSLSAAQTRLAAPDSGMRAAVRDRSQALLTMLHSRSDRIWELDVTGITSEVDGLVTLASRQVGVEVQGVALLASPQKAEAERQLSELASIVHQMIQLHQQLTIRANGPGMVPRPGYVLSAIKAPPGASFRSAEIDGDASAGATSRALQDKLQPLVRQVSDRAARERSIHGVK